MLHIYQKGPQTIITHRHRILVHLHPPPGQEELTGKPTWQRGPGWTRHPAPDQAWAKEVLKAQRADPPSIDPTNLPDQMDTIQAAAILGVTGETIRRWCRAGKMGRKVGIGQEWRINKEEVEELLK